MNYLIIDETLHCATTATIMCILQFMNSYRKKNNINMHDIEKIYVKKERAAPFELIFDNDYKIENTISLIFDEKSVIETQNYNNIYNNLDYKLLAKKLCFSKKVKDIINSEIKNLDNNTLGIHFRFTDMNASHLKSNPTTYTNYLKEIYNYIVKYDIKNIFIASDNTESINKLLNDISSNNIKINYRNVKRYHKEKADDKDLLWYKTNDATSHQYLNNFKDNIFNINDSTIHLECIIDCLLLSKCKHLIFSYSNISNLAILISETIENNTKISKEGH